ncbi:hypothetical protein EHQ12_15150 [Leptospira gomenensis]|uniref:Uncharacterized protein n=1 Tax=Leptospira gomenensis TaxID=2484974 RepID=A0A5F1YZZ5_9LEPT|nr:hypothetical protein [Leptospira gomenensis]TGK30999.1 hypothetical protein EHQ17_14875 [Leptospira gomenensis]TGK35622.1 hypothetical protein EHQ12_15150 [Leptospira gomenensis]TGK45281.1 hypothetical protein EHQ07_10125 [Leptospira gomenensis]TGK66195.1 hypothetical protein EHQ13_03860 [Leptospira gomenensis]
MDLSEYIVFIKNLPFKEQSFFPHLSRWEKLLSDSVSPRSLPPDIAEGYSRGDLMDGLSLSEDKVIKILMWGYPYGGRGNNIKNVLSSIPEIVRILKDIETSELNERELVEISKKFEDIKGLGRSTWSKFLYFNATRFEGGPLLILDQKIERALNGKSVNGIRFCVLNDKDGNTYVEYLRSMNGLGDRLNLSTDALELFFFMFYDIFRLFRNR